MQESECSRQKSEGALFPPFRAQSSVFLYATDSLPFSVTLSSNCIATLEVLQSKAQRVFPAKENSIFLCSHIFCVILLDFIISLLFREKHVFENLTLKLYFTNQARNRIQQADLPRRHVLVFSMQQYMYVGNILPRTSDVCQSP